ncbi:MAG: hypothetical protein KAR79_02750 [Simkaniaceae bacterium]|nr:hypothetical protein [Simkaniaceae bacterium]
MTTSAYSIRYDDAMYSREKRKTYSGNGTYNKLTPSQKAAVQKAAVLKSQGLFEQAKELLRKNDLQGKNKTVQEDCKIQTVSDALSSETTKATPIDAQTTPPKAEAQRTESFARNTFNRPAKPTLAQSLQVKHKPKISLEGKFGIIHRKIKSLDEKATDFISKIKELSAEFDQELDRAYPDEEKVPKHLGNMQLLLSLLANNNCLSSTTKCLEFAKSDNICYHPNLEKELLKIVINPINQIKAQIKIIKLCKEIIATISTAKDEYKNRCYEIKPQDNPIWKIFANIYNYAFGKSSFSESTNFQLQQKLMSISKNTSALPDEKLELIQKFTKKVREEHSFLNTNSRNALINLELRLIT